MHALLCKQAPYVLEPFDIEVGYTSSIVFRLSRYMAGKAVNSDNESKIDCIAIGGLFAIICRVW